MAASTPPGAPQTDSEQPSPASGDTFVLRISHWTGTNPNGRGQAAFLLLATPDLGSTLTMLELAHKTGLGLGQAALSGTPAPIWIWLQDRNKVAVMFDGIALLDGQLPTEWIAQAWADDSAILIIGAAQYPDDMTREHYLHTNQRLMVWIRVPAVAGQWRDDLPPPIVLSGPLTHPEVAVHRDG